MHPTESSFFSVERQVIGLVQYYFTLRLNRHRVYVKCFSKFFSQVKGAEEFYQTQLSGGGFMCVGEGVGRSLHLASSPNEFSRECKFAGGVPIVAHPQYNLL